MIDNSDEDDEVIVHLYTPFFVCVRRHTVLLHSCRTMDKTDREAEEDSKSTIPVNDNCVNYAQKIGKNVGNCDKGMLHS